MADKRGLRAWVKVQLRDDNASYAATDAVNEWRGERRAAYHLIRAILLYAALLRGDVNVLREMFPLLFSGINTTGATVDPTLNQPPATPKKPIKSRVVQKTATEDVDDFMESLGL